MEFGQRRRLARARGPLEIDCPIAGRQHRGHGLLLFGPESIGRDERLPAAEWFELSNSAVDRGDHLPLPGEAVARGDVVARAEQSAGRFLDAEPGLSLVDIDAAAAMA